MREDITPESLMILDGELKHLHESAASIRGWARRRGLEELHLAAVQTEDSVLLAVRLQIRRKQNLAIDRLVNSWMRQRAMAWLREKTIGIARGLLRKTAKTYGTART